MPSWVITLPLTETRPAEIRSSASRLEQIPEAAIYLFNLTRSSLAWLLPEGPLDLSPGPLDLPAGPLLLPAGPLDLPAGPLLLSPGPLDLSPGSLLTTALLTGEALENEFSPPDKRDPGLLLLVDAEGFPVPFLCCPGLLKCLIIKDC